MKKESGQIKIKVCRKCRAPLHENSLHNYCEACFRKVEETFDKIRDYLKEYPASTSFEIQQRLGISMHIINNYIKDGRLIEIPNEFLNLECAKCGCLLLSAHHKFCPPCEIEMIRSLDKAKEDLASNKIDIKETGKMRFRTYR
ncbi:hypothetical protein [Alkaliphilus serpentinus]|uniref:Flagellar operon protein TIGR03826 n=1 Tax=Alkaliphilus serpentinus TaxID=1482731 RepID=A0A833M8X2_9FIRM|nr:hypothetical protein [Alkaliphilus serpentinus]KAB3527596.1 hypothetical protein F8153_11470 [Alkaliphilus serpentinus]